MVLNTLSSQIIPLGHYYKISLYAKSTRRYIAQRQHESFSKRVALLPLDIEDGGDFMVLDGVLGDLMMYRSCDKRWTKIEGRSYRDMVSFKGKFYVVDMSRRGHVFVIEPSLEVSEIHSVKQSHKCFEERLVVSGDELLLVQRFKPGTLGREHMYTWFRLFRLEDEEPRRWVRVNDLVDRALFLGINWNLCYSAKKVPGVKGNCVYFVEPNTAYQTILVFELGTRKTSKASESEWRGDMGAFGDNLESLMECGILTVPIPSISFFDVDSDVDSE